MFNSALAAFSFLNEKVLRNTKEDSITKSSAFTILLANLKHKFRARIGSELKL